MKAPKRHKISCSCCLRVPSQSPPLFDFCILTKSLKKSLKPGGSYPKAFQCIFKQIIRLNQDLSKVLANDRSVWQQGVLNNHLSHKCNVINYFGATSNYNTVSFIASKVTHSPKHIQQSSTYPEL